MATYKVLTTVDANRRIIKEQCGVCGSENLSYRGTTGGIPTPLGYWICRDCYSHLIGSTSK